MGSYIFVADPNSKDKIKVQGMINDLMSKDQEGKFLRKPGPNKTIVVTDNRESETLSPGNRNILASRMIDGVTEYRGLQQAGGPSTLFINFQARDGKAPLNIFVHEIGHFKWPGLGTEDNHNPLFYKLLNDSLEALKIPVDRQKDLNGEAVEGIQAPTGYSDPLTYYHRPRRGSLDLPSEVVEQAQDRSYTTTFSADGRNYEFYQFASDTTTVIGRATSVISDVGLENFTTYTIGNLARKETTYDPRGSTNFAQIERNYDAQGRLFLQEAYGRDDVFQRTYYDVDNTSDASSTTYDVDENDNILTALTIKDDGSRTYTYNDVANQADWKAYAEHYDAAGIKKSRYIVADDGSAKSERWLSGLKSPNLPEATEYYDSTGSIVRAVHNEYGVIAGTETRVLGRTTTTDVANIHKWYQTIVFYYQGSPVQTATVIDGGFTIPSIPMEYFNPSWNFAAPVDSNLTLVQRNMYSLYDSSRMSPLGIPSLGAYNPIDNFASNYSGYRGWDFGSAATNNPFYNIQLMAPKKNWYFDFDPSVGNLAPVVLDLEGDGIEINLHSTSSAMFDVLGDGALRQTAWAGSRDGILAVDLSPDGKKGSDGKIDQLGELSFSIVGQSDKVAEMSDLERLRANYDSNHDGVLNSSDERYAEFVLWRDINSDGVSQAGEIRSLKDAGIAEIDLARKGDGAALPDGTIINGMSSYKTAGGKTFQLADMSFGYAAGSGDERVTSNASTAVVSQNNDASYDIKYYLNGVLQKVEINDLKSGFDISKIPALEGLDKNVSGSSFNEKGSENPFKTSSPERGADFAIAAAAAPVNFASTAPTDGNDNIFGSSQNDVLRGLGGNDLIQGNYGSDLIYGNTGDDRTFGGPGLDTIYAGQGNDLLVGGLQGDLLYGGIGDDTLWGGRGLDKLYGDDGNDYLDGGTDNDLAYGGNGSDTVHGGSEADTLFGGAGSDFVYGNLGNDLIYGNTENDALFGGQGDDTIYGGQGDDLISGGAGVNIMIGGGGADRFLLSTAPNAGVIIDFNRGAGDQILLGGQSYSVATTITGNALIVTSGGGAVELAGVRREQVDASYFG